MIGETANPFMSGKKISKKRHRLRRIIDCLNLLELCSFCAPNKAEQGIARESMGEQEQRKGERMNTHAIQALTSMSRWLNEP
jgi:hypothetical protein